MSALGDTWPIERAMFGRYAEGGRLLMEGNRGVGLVLYDRGADTGSIRAVVVRPEARHRGVGRVLMDSALQQLGSRLQPGGRLRLGGGFRYLWPGIPENLGASRGFFDTVLGWPFAEPSVDMVMSLRAFSPPPGCFERPSTAGISFRTARAVEFPAVLAFSELHFPGWTDYFREHSSNDIVIGVDEAGRIAGALLLDMPPILWSTLLGPGTAEIGAVGVDPARHGQGVGTALVACACEILRERGVETAMVRWLYRENFYRHVGFEIWKRYAISSKELE